MKQPLKIVIPFVFCMVCLSSIAGDKPIPDLSSWHKRANIKMLSTFLFTAGGNIADGNRVVFDPQYSNAVDGNDAIKVMNPGENFGLLRDRRTLAVEARQPASGNDTLFYNMSNLIPQRYKLEIDPENLELASSASCELIDRYLNTRTSISLSDSNHFTLEITSDPASMAADRLMVVFGTAVNVSPFKFCWINAINDGNKAITLNWQVKQEQDIVTYEIERSGDNSHFTSLSVIMPSYNDPTGNGYLYNDKAPLNTDNFYRIRSIDKTGISTYSTIVKVSLTALKTTATLYPNPVTSRSFQVQLQDLQPGKYFIKLTANSGQQICSYPVNITGGIFVQTIRLGANVSKGDYNVSVWSEDGIVSTQWLAVE